MGKRIIKNKKPKLARSSSIEKTIDEGKDFIVRVDQRFRKARVAPAKPRHINIATQHHRKIAKGKNNKRPTKAVKPTPVPKSAPQILTPAVVPVARSASRNLSKSGSKGNIIIEQQLQDRLGREKASIGKLNFSLRWWDPNDLDLHVICPCGTQICYMNKKCTKCQGQLDVDMNVGMNMSLEPVEHVYFKSPKRGLYKFFVRYFYGSKQYQGVKGGNKSKYALSLHEDLNQIFRYEDNVSQQQREIHYDFNK